MAVVCMALSSRTEPIRWLPNGSAVVVCSFFSLRLRGLRCPTYTWCPDAEPPVSVQRPSPHEAVGVIGAKADALVMAADALKLGEHVLVAERFAVRVDVGVATRDVEQRGHLLHVFGHNQGVGLARGLESIVAGRGDPVVLEIVPPAAQGEGMHWAGVAVTREPARGADAQDVHVVAPADAKHERLGRDGPPIRAP